MAATELRDLALRWLAECWAATVVDAQAARGSVPREDGTRVLVTANPGIGAIVGVRATR